MKFSAEPFEQSLDVIAKRFFRPCHEVTPVIFGLLPEDFDHVQFRTVPQGLPLVVRWQVAKEGVELLHPAQRDAVVEAVMDACVIEDDEGRRVLVLGNLRDQVFHEFDKGFTVDRTRYLPEVETLAGKIQGAHDRYPLMGCRQGGVRTAHGRPGTLHGRRRTKARLVVVEQLTSRLARPSLQPGKFFLASGKSDRVPFFFRLMRVRLKLKPRALSVFPSVSSVTGSVH